MKLKFNVVFLYGNILYAWSTNVLSIKRTYLIGMNFVPSYFRIPSFSEGHEQEQKNYLSMTKFLFRQAYKTAMPLHVEESIYVYY